METVALRAGFFCVLRNSMQPVWLIGKLYRTEVPKCNRKLYSPVLSCTHHGKIPAAKPGFVCFADKDRIRICFLVFYLVFISAGFSCTGETRLGKACAGKAVLGQKAPKAGNLGRYMAGRAPCRCGANAPRQGRFSRRQGRCAGVPRSSACVQLLARG